LGDDREIERSLFCCDRVNEHCGVACFDPLWPLAASEADQYDNDGQCTDDDGNGQNCSYDLFENPDIRRLTPIRSHIASTPFDPKTVKLGQI
jgi:hypothetical protein